MAQKQRGQEGTLRITVDGVVQAGSFVKVKNFKVTPQTTISRQQYLGEDKADLDISHDGVDFSFEVDNVDAKTLEFLHTIVTREENRLAHPVINLAFISKYRAGSAPTKTLVMYESFMKVDDHNVGGRTEIVTTSFSGMSKRSALV